MLVLVEKMSLASAIHEHLLALFPGETLTYLGVNGFGWPFVFDYPSKLSWHDYPFWQEARFKLNTRSQWQFKPDANGKFFREYVDYAALTPQAVLALPDPDNTGMFAANMLMEHLHSLGKVAQWHGYRFLVTLAPDTLTQQLTVAIPDAVVAQGSEARRLKADFDYSFLVNAAGLLTRTYHAVGGQESSPVFSKYTVALLYKLKSMDYVTDGLLMQEMVRWTGSGKYVNNRVRMGSPASMGPLVDGLRQLGFIERRGTGYRIQLSPLGAAFLERLHPDCEDADLPFRLDNWQADPVAGRVAAQRYIRTWFGKQKRFMG